MKKASVSKSDKEGKINWITNLYMKGVRLHEARKTVCPLTGKTVNHTLVDNVYRALRDHKDPLEILLRKHKPKLDENCCTLIKNRMELNPHTSIYEVQSALSEMNVNVSTGTISTALKSLGYSYRPPKKQTNLTKLQKERRVKWCYSFLQNGPEPLKLIFSDESRFCTQSDKGYIWIKRGSKNPLCYRNLDKFPQGIMVYGAIGLNYKSKLVLCDGTIDSRKYQKNIELSLMLEDLRDRDFIFMQDGARSHTSKETIRWLQKRMNVLLNWPSNSPDLNPIEHLWAIMKRRLRQLNITKKEDLIENIYRIWDEIPMEHINNLVLSFVSRCKICIALNGECINEELRKRSDHLNVDVSFQHFTQDLYGKEQLVAVKDPTLPNWFSNEGKEFTRDEKRWLLTKLSGCKKLDAPPYARWSRSLERTREEVENMCSEIRQSIWEQVLHSAHHNAQKENDEFVGEKMAE